MEETDGTRHNQGVKELGWLDVLPCVPKAIGYIREAGASKNGKYKLR